MKILNLLKIILLMIIFSSLVYSPSSVYIMPEEPTNNQDLVCGVTSATVETYDDYEYEWRVNGAVSDITSRFFPATETEVGDSVTCIVTTALGDIAGLDTVTILEEEKAAENNPPMVDITMPDDGETFHVGRSILFSAVGTDSDGDSLTYAWNFGDLTFTDGRTRVHSYDEPGTYTVSVTASDSSLEDVDSITINIISEVEENQPPVAVINSDSVVETNEPVIFDGSESYDPDGIIVSYEWTFGDGSTGSGEVVTHDFDSYGIYTITLTVYDNELESDTTSKTIIVLPTIFEENEPPIAVINAGQDTTNSLVGIFDGSESYDPDGTIVSYEWTFGDGSTGTGVSPIHTYSFPGTYIITLRVTDNDGATDSEVALLRVGELPERPVAVINAERQDLTPAGLVYNLDGSESYDPDGTIVNYEWTFGDGSTGSGEVVTYAYRVGEIYTTTLTVTDNDGLQDTTSITIDLSLSTFLDRGPDYDKQRINPSVTSRDFEISRVEALQSKPYYSKGERITLLVKLTNEGGFKEDIDLKLLVPEFNYQNNINGMEIDTSQVKLLTIDLSIPSNANPGLYLAKLSLTSNDNEILPSLAYWQFIVV